jgi:plasmid stabilization system protein ParE
VVDRLTRRSQQIAEFPRSGPVLSEAQDVNVRQVIEGPYRIIYHILDDEIDVIAVVHSAQQWPPED